MPNIILSIVTQGTKPRSSAFIEKENLNIHVLVIKSLTLYLRKTKSLTLQHIEVILDYYIALLRKYRSSCDAKESVSS